jgi:hypothetical protein
LAAAIALNSMSRGGEYLAQERGHPLRFLVDLIVAQALHFESERAQLEISPSVVAECLLSAVVLVAIGFDHEADVAPDEVRLVLADLNIDLRHRKARSPADPQEVALEIAAGAVMADVLAKRQTKHLGLADRSPHLGLRNSSTEINDRL